MMVSSGRGSLNAELGAGFSPNLADRIVDAVIDV
jgi:hypothetical protein